VLNDRHEAAVRQVQGRQSASADYAGSIGIRGAVWPWGRENPEQIHSTSLLGTANSNSRDSAAPKKLSPILAERMLRRHSLVLYAFRYGPGYLILAHGFNFLWRTKLAIPG
jgi:hypothetical protein